jgi:ribulose-phosphate 3-epimerase
MPGQTRIAPSILSADLGRLAEQVKAVEEGGADWIHVDVMDGRFVPNLTFGANMVASLKRLTKLPLDVHLMVVEPEQYIDAMADAGAAVFTLHPEATVHVQRQLARVKERGMRAGLALNPGSPLALADEVAADLDLLLIMSVNPGFGGQAYLPASTSKIKRARELLSRVGSAAALEVDGGITNDTIAAARAAGADTFVAGSAIFGGKNPAQAVRDLRQHAGTKA